MCCVFTVEMLLDVLPALLVPGAGGVRVGEFVDERDLGPAGEERVEVELLQRHPAVGAHPAGHELEPRRHGGGRPPAVGLDEADDDVAALAEEPLALLEHRVRLADAGRGAEQYPQPTPFHVVILPSAHSRVARLS
jgi:hypothetical protein